MKCPHCSESFHAEFFVFPTQQGLIDEDGAWLYRCTICPACQRAIIFVRLATEPQYKERMAYPKVVARSPLPPEVTEPFASDYREACKVLADSPKASAALSRRCLQNLLREKAGVTWGNLSNEIEQVLKSKQLPSDLASAVDVIRVVGNFAAHSIKSINTGEIIDVEPGEAEWNLDVLEVLFEFYFVRPARLAEKRDALNRKLIDAGKPPMSNTALPFTSPAAFDWKKIVEQSINARRDFVQWVRSQFEQYKVDKVQDLPPHIQEQFKKRLLEIKENHSDLSREEG